MDITYDYYRIFYYVATCKSFSRAAGLLSANQSNLSRFINNLEQQLGCKLFVRSNRGISLTPEGEKLYSHVKIAQEQFRAAELELINDKNLSGGTITISVSDTALHGHLLPILAAFHSTHPGIHLRILNHTTPQAIQVLKNRLVHFAVVTSPSNIRLPLKETCLKSFQEILIGGRHYSFLKDTPHNLSELLQYPFVCLGKDTVTYEFFSNLLLKYDLVFKPDIEVASTNQLMPMIKNDLGIGFIPEHFAREALESGEVFSIPLKEKIPRRSICLVENTSRCPSIAANALKQMILSQDS
ncbi:LysR family transcriptional regulator [Lacrimispora amygdalina]|uniref:LysR family transcriptional regulator n=1 Tax=Lacrimispora amygdalina TaxID=253257 RepID=A0A3E2NDL5_9FIRM|nr:LysR family transcriptional regulator [Clostridium indicum]RFZ79074.1 LysR family transcriptional regulator [Clostridium indicum]